MSDRRHKLSPRRKKPARKRRDLRGLVVGSDIVQEAEFWKDVEFRLGVRSFAQRPRA